MPSPSWPDRRRDPASMQLDRDHARVPRRPRPGPSAAARPCRRSVRRRFEELSNGDAGRVVARFGPRSVLTMAGDHALGGEWRGREAVGEWFARLFRLFPGIAIEPRVVAVTGWPWHTTIATQF